ncbi:hypothetical protein PMAYCL1PPCAC_24123, partial [Pristionchus mayeri]
GNQRDLARAKNLKKQQDAKKSQGASGQSGNAGLSTQARMERDAAAMKVKQEKAAAKKAEEDAAKGATAKVAKIDPLAIMQPDLSPHLHTQECNVLIKLLHKDNNPRYAKRLVELQNLPEDYYTPVLHRMKEEGKLPHLNEQSGCKI